MKKKNIKQTDKLRKLWKKIYNIIMLQTHWRVIHAGVKSKRELQLK